MEDVIFAGTERRRPVNFAQVTLTLGNQDRSLYYDADEVAISRKMYRSGESEYLINGVKCRLRDVQELLMDTGIGKDGYGKQKVVLIEDLISTGSSSLKAVEAIRKADGDCSLCLAIFTYGLKAASDAFAALDPECIFYTILSYDTMIHTAHETGYISSDEADILREWREDPFGWGEKRGWPREVKA